MLWLILGGLLGTGAGLFAWGVVRIRRHTAQATAALRTLDVAAIPALAEECRRAFAERLDLALDSAEPDAAAWALDRAIRSGRAQLAFARPGLGWAYVLPVGAFLGELIRHHQPATWHPDATGSPRLVIGAGEAAMETYPFDKVLKHRFGADGELYAYVQVALRGPAAVGAAALHPPEA